MGLKSTETPFAPVLSSQSSAKTMVFFAINTPSGKADRETRSQIRSHVQRYLQSQRRALAGLSTKKPSKPIRSNRKKLLLSELQSCMSCGSNEQCCHHAQDARYDDRGHGNFENRKMVSSIRYPQTRLVRSSMLDPFDQTAVPIDQSMHRLLRYCTCHFLLGLENQLTN